MKWHSFIFSEKWQIRLLRHALFLIAWTAYFVLCDYLFRQPRPAIPTYGAPRTGYLTLGPHWLAKAVLFLALYAAACYFFIYVILPQSRKNQWIRSLTNLLLLCVVLFLLAWFIYWSLFPFIDALANINKTDNYFAQFWPPLYLGVINAGKVVASAAIIESIKYWWVKQKQKEKLQREKMIAELQLLKSQIHPDFLFGALSNIQAHCLKASPSAPDLLLKLADLLSYMLYECDKPFVRVEKEVAMLKNYIEIEKERLYRPFDVELNVRGELRNNKIAPFLLLPFIEKVFNESNMLAEQGWLNIDIDVRENFFYMKLINGIFGEKNDSLNTAVTGLDKVQKRLTLLYPQHELKIYKQQEMLITFLKIHLNDFNLVEVSEVEEAALAELR